MNYTKQQILDIVNTQLLFWIKKDETVKSAVFELIQTKHPTKEEMDDKFDRVLKELANDREVQEKKWEEWKTEDKKKWEEWKVEDKRKWDDWKAEDKRKWEENQKTINALLEKIEAIGERQDLMLEKMDLVTKKHDQSMGAIGARWGIRTEASFRNALKGILKEINSEYEISHYTEYDNEGIVYGVPNDVEIDVLMKNGNVYLIEMSSNITMGDIRIFRDKILFYEKNHKQKIKYLIVVSPMIDEKARKYALASGIKLYSFAEDIDI